MTLNFYGTKQTRLTEKGGLPGIAFARAAKEQRSLFEDWLSLVCYRDLQQFRSLRLDGDLAFNISRQTCLLEEPSSVEIARKLRQPGRRVQSHIMALEQLFAIQKISPHPAGSGKPIYLILDAGLANYPQKKVFLPIKFWTPREFPARRWKSLKPSKQRSQMQSCISLYQPPKALLAAI